MADAVITRFSPCPTVVLCGPGNNGGDGYVVARLLIDAGWPVTVAGTDRDKLAGDAAAAAVDWPNEVRRLSLDVLDGAELLIDALFGAGLKRPLTPELQALLKEVAARKIPLVAIDLPSGLDGDTGQPLEHAPKAALTVTFHRKKPAHVLDPGRCKPPGAAPCG